MADGQLVEELLQALDGAGIEIKEARLTTEAPGAGSGLVTLRGKKIFILGVDQDPDELLEALAKALAHVDLDNVYLSPAARALIEGGGELTTDEHG